MFLRSVLSKQKCAPYGVNPTERRLNAAEGPRCSTGGIPDSLPDGKAHGRHGCHTQRRHEELIACAKSRPGQLNHGSVGLGSTTYLAAELFKSLSGIDALHVPYKGGASALSDLVGGQLSV